MCLGSRTWRWLWEAASHCVLSSHRTVAKDKCFYFPRAQICEWQSASTYIMNWHLPRQKLVVRCVNHDWIEAAEESPMFFLLPYITPLFPLSTNRFDLESVQIRDPCSAQSNPCYLLMADRELPGSCANLEAFNQCPFPNHWHRSGIRKTSASLLQTHGSNQELQQVNWSESISCVLNATTWIQT